MKSLIFIFLVIAISGCTEYKLGVLEEKYPQYFSKPTLKYNSEYSWHTSVPLDNKIIKIEHGVIANNDDIKKLNLPNGEYIFFSIEFQKQKISVIEVDLLSSGKKLQAVGSYVFKSYTDDNCNKYASKPNWKIVKLESDEIKEPCSFGFVKLFHAPKESYIYSMVPKVFWFNNNIQQNIRITTGEGIHNFDFELVWHKSSSLWWKILTIT